ncbi:TolC family protein [Gaetbulibacter aestuarii]|uniref:TolC family protein n=1 Tax=Gaetbulibacter aestuarii TaxID=1502358 RepID=A0ABW7N1A8_9FLAO
MKQLSRNIKLCTVLAVFGSVLSMNAQELDEFIQQAIMNNPEIYKVELQYNLSSEKVNEVNTLPNTEFGLGYFVSEPETRTGPQRFKVSVKQMIPWFGTITARENYAKSMADAEYEDLVIAKRQLVVSVSKHYYKLYALHAKQNVLDENIELLETYRTMALNAVETGKGSAVAVLKLQMRENDLKKQKAVIKQDITSEQASLNKLINRDSGVKIKIPKVLELPDAEMDSISPNLDMHPELLKYDKLYASVAQSELVNKSESQPMLGFGLDYINVAERPNMDFSDNGKDILMPMVSVSIPIFNQKYRSTSKQHTLKQQELKAAQQNRRNTLESLLQKAIADRNAARITYNTQKENLDQARNAEKILIKNYETGTIDFNDVLDIQELQLKFQLQMIEAVTNYYIQTTNINYIAS